MTPEDLKLCLACGPTATLAVTLPAMGLCPDCLAKRGWAHLPTADVLQRLGAPPTPAPADLPPPTPRFRQPQWRYRVVTAPRLEALAEALTAWDAEVDRRGGGLRHVHWETLQQPPARLAWAVVVVEEVRTP